MVLLPDNPGYPPVLTHFERWYFFPNKNHPARLGYHHFSGQPPFLMIFCKDREPPMTNHFG